MVMGPPPRACLFMTPARVPMSVPLLLEHVHGNLSQSGRRQSCRIVNDQVFGHGYGRPCRWMKPGTSPTGRPQAVPGDDRIESATGHGLGLRAAGVIPARGGKAVQSARAEAADQGSPARHRADVPRGPRTAVDRPVRRPRSADPAVRDPDARRLRGDIAAPSGPVCAVCESGRNSLLQRPRWCRVVAGPPARPPSGRAAPLVRWSCAAPVSRAC